MKLFSPGQAVAEVGERKGGGQSSKMFKENKQERILKNCNKKEEAKSKAMLILI